MSQVTWVKQLFLFQDNCNLFLTVFSDQIHTLQSIVRLCWQHFVTKFMSCITIVWIQLNPNLIYK